MSVNENCDYEFSTNRGGFVFTFSCVCVETQFVAINLWMSQIVLMGMIPILMFRNTTATNGMRNNLWNELKGHLRSANILVN